MKEIIARFEKGMSEQDSIEKASAYYSAYSNALMAVLNINVVKLLDKELRLIYESQCERILSEMEKMYKK